MIVVNYEDEVKKFIIILCAELASDDEEMITNFVEHYFYTNQQLFRSRSELYTFTREIMKVNCNTSTVDEIIKLTSNCVSLPIECSVIFHYYITNRTAIEQVKKEGNKLRRQLQREKRHREVIARWSRFTSINNLF